ncbi:MAG TPA: TIGR04282 family arsenosugar biosynthesis glycosyltransferase [Gemmatimonadaceae bacterium]|nr:TIGR04282 family arsenosugar biosynthesis glycosyltransferase [Gemmatimonadaceae bacterium]
MTTDNPRRALVMLTRAPRAGRVKTRIAKALGDAKALAIHRELTERAAAAARAVRDTQLVVAHTPADAGDEMRAWLGNDFRYEPQRGSDLGQRMAAAIEERLSSGADRVIVIGSDAPDLTTEMIEEAFDALGGADVVVGPAADGGYYLIGMGTLQRSLFERIPWSGPETLARTLAAIRAAGLRLHLLEILRDVDTAEDWRDWARRNGRLAD